MRYLFISLLTLLSVSAVAQSQFRGGVAAGVCTSQIDGDGYAGFDKAGPSVGGFLNAPVSKKLDWQFEVLYVAKGSRQIPDYDRGIPYKEIRIAYAEVPVMLKYHYRKFIFDLGLSAGSLVSHKEFDDGGELSRFSVFKKWELAYLIDISYNLFSTFDLCVRFAYSVLPVRDEFLIRKGFGPIGGSYNNVIHYSLRYQFGKKRDSADPAGPKEE